MRYNSRLIRVCVNVFSLCLLAGFLFSIPGFNYLNHDSQQYIEVSNQLLSGTLFLISPYSESVLRTPGFPAILAGGRLLAPHNLRLAVQLAHGALFLAAMIFVGYSWRTLLPFPLVVLIGAILSFFFSSYFPCITTEWSTLSTLLFVSGAAFLYIRTHSEKWLLTTAFFSSLVPLIRPSCLFVFLIPILLGVRSRKKSTLIKVILIAFFLPSLWMLGNYWRIQQFTLAPISGMGMFCIASILGPLSPSLQYSPSLNKFIQHYSPPGSSVFNDALTNLSSTQGQELFFNKCGPFTMQGIEEAKKLSWSYTEIDETFKAYFQASLISHIDQYWRYFWREGSYFLQEVFFTLCLVMGVTYWRKKTKKSEPLTYLYIIAVCHICHCAMIFPLHPLLPRYTSITMALLLFSVGLTFFSEKNVGGLHQEQT